MKPIFALTLICLSAMFSAAQVVSIPDTNFLRALIDRGVDVNNNRQIEVSEAETVTYLEVAAYDYVNNGGVYEQYYIPFYNIVDLTGIEAFTSLTTLDCSFNKISSLNLSNNKKLKYLLCSINQLTELVLDSQQVTYIDARDNNISNLNLGNDTSLVTLLIARNVLTNADFSKCRNILSLDVRSNKFTSVDVSKCTKLKDLKLGGNMLSTIELSNNPLLTHLDVSNNKLTELDLRPQQDLMSLNAEKNFLSQICINTTVIPRISGFKKDENTLWSTTCTPEPTLLIPDRNFTAALIAAGVDKNLNGGIEFSEALAITSLTVSNAAIIDLKGIEHFKNLEYLDCSKNKLTKLYLDKNTKLVTVICSENNIDRILIDKSPDLKYFNANTNRLTFIDLTNNPALLHLYLGKNRLTFLDLTRNKLLKRLSFYSNSIQYINLYENKKIQYLSVASNGLKYLDVSLLPALEYLYVLKNQLKTLKIDKNNSLISVDVRENPLPVVCISPLQMNSTAAWAKSPQTQWSICPADTDEVYIPDPNFKLALIELGSDVNSNGKIEKGEVNKRAELNLTGKNIYDLTGIEEFAMLSSLRLEDNKLTRLDLSRNAPLSLLSCSNNSLKSLDLRANPKLIYLYCNNNPLETLQVDNSPNLHTLSFSNTKLKGINIRNNTKLVSLTGNGSAISSIDLSQNIMLEGLNLYKNELNSIDLSKNTKLRSLDLSSNKINSVNLNNNISLTFVNLTNNELTAFDPSKLALLTSLMIGFNKLSSLDVSKNNNLTSLFYCNKNNLSKVCVTQTQINLYAHYWVKDDTTAWVVCNPVSRKGSTFDEESTEAQYQIYPNPSRNYITVSHGVYEINNVTIRNLQGIKEMDLKETKGNIDISSLTPGQYIIELATDHEKVIRKLIVE